MRKRVIFSLDRPVKPGDDEETAGRWRRDGQALSKSVSVSKSVSKSKSKSITITITSTGTSTI